MTTRLNTQPTPSAKLGTEPSIDAINRLVNLDLPPFLTTKAFCKLFNLKPQTARKHYCLNGHCYGVVPKKMPNKKLGWPTDKALKVLYSEEEAV